MKILAISDVPSKALWDYNTREKLEGIDLILSCGDLPKKYLEYLTNFTTALPGWTVPPGKNWASRSRCRRQKRLCPMRMDFT